MPENRTNAMRWFFYATLAQLPVGAWFFLSLPKAQQKLFMGGDPLGTALFVLGLVFTLASLHFAWRERVWPTALTALAAIVLMTVMRGMLRSAMLYRWYAPDVRAIDPGPLLLFAGALIVSAAALYWLAKIYLRHAPSGVHKNPAASGPVAGASQDELEALRKTLLVLELDQPDKDEEQTTANARAAANDPATGGAK